MHTRSLLMSLALAAGCGDKDGDDTSGGEEASAAESSGARLSRHLRGTFDSEEQSREQPTYYAISLVTCQIEAPELGDDVLYVEQAVMDTPEAPYRQRLYVIETVDDTTALSRVFELTDPDAWIGTCSGDAVPSAGAGDAEEKVGCAVEMVISGEQLVGGTVGTDCATDLNGADHATSEITLDAERLESWDRGFFADGAQA